MNRQRFKRNDARLGHANNSEFGIRMMAGRASASDFAPSDFGFAAFPLNYSDPVTPGLKSGDNASYELPPQFHL